VLLWIGVSAFAVLVGAAVNAAIDRVWPSVATAAGRAEAAARAREDAARRRAWEQRTADDGAAEITPPSEFPERWAQFLPHADVRSRLHHRRTPRQAPRTPETQTPETKAPETKTPETPAPEARTPEPRASENGGAKNLAAENGASRDSRPSDSGPGARPSDSRPEDAPPQDAPSDGRTDAADNPVRSATGGSVPDAGGQ
ncbi:YihY/virulence factor BrkB family protein, partial [Streptomyces sp. MCAF7]